LNDGIRRANFLLVLLQHQDFLTIVDELKLMGHQDNNLVGKMPLDALSKDFASDLWVHSAQWIIKQVDISIRIDGSRQADTCFLAT